MTDNAPANRHDVNRLLNKFSSLDNAPVRSSETIAQQGANFDAQMQREQRMSDIDQLDRSRARQQAARDAKNN